MNSGKSPEAEDKFRDAMQLYQKLADDNPAVTEFRDNLAPATTTSATC